MLITRRGFARGSLSLAVAQVAAPALCQNSDRSSALTAIGAYGLAHLQHFGLPGLTLGVTTGDGLSTVMDFGYANPGTGVKISPGTLFQIGSISKLVTSAIFTSLQQKAGSASTIELARFFPPFHFLQETRSRSSIYSTIRLALHRMSPSFPMAVSGPPIRPGSIGTIPTLATRSWDLLSNIWVKSRSPRLSRSGFLVRLGCDDR